MKRCEFLNHSIITNRGIYNNITVYENSLESIMSSIKNNLSISIEIRMTKDKEIIVFSDEEMDRLIKLKDKVNTITKEELNYISQYYVPTLKETLKLINNKVPVIINIKEDNKVFRNKLLNILKEYKDNLALQSTIIEAIKFYKKKDFITGLIIDEKVNEDYLNKEIEVDFLSIKYDLIDKVKANMLKKKYYIIGYILEKREDVEHYIKIYNNIIVDNIEEVFK